MKNCKKNHEALASQRQTDALFEQVNDIVENAKKFPVLLFFNEAEAHALSVFVRKYNFKGHVKVTKRISKNKQRILKNSKKGWQKTSSTTRRVEDGRVEEDGWECNGFQRLVM